VLAGAFIVTMDAALGDLKGDIHVVGDRIARIGPHLASTVSPGTVIVDAADSIIMPGLIDSHVHAWEGQLRGIAPEADFGAYAAMTHGGIAKHMRPDDIGIGQRITAAQAINGGVTTLIDNSHNSRSAAHSDAAVEALQQTGIRAVHAVGAPAAGSGGAQLPADLLRLRAQYFSSEDQLLSLRMFDITPSIATWTYAMQNDFDLVAEMGPWIPNLDALLATGLLREGHTYNHCSGLTTDQWSAIAASGAAVNMAPRSDSHFGLGAFAPIIEANRHAIQEGISCDNELSYGYDMFTEMRTLMTIQRGLSFQLELAGESHVPARYGPRDVLRAATVGGAINAGLSAAVGTIAPGKKADLVVLDLDQVNTKLFGSVVGTVVSYAGIANVDTVFIDGIVKKWAGRLVGVDYDALVTEAIGSREFLLGKVGLSLDTIRLGSTPNVPADDEDQALHAIVSSSGH